jgi:hypothetical protein
MLKGTTVCKKNKKNKDRDTNMEGRRTNEIIEK